MDFSTQLRLIRTLRGWSQLDLAKATGIPNTYLSDMETGKSLPGREWEQRIRQALAWPPDADAAFAILEQEPAHQESAT